MSAEILVVRCGTVPYEEARAAQERLESARQQGAIPDVLLLLEHPPVYTRGRRATAEELPMGVEWYEAQGIEVRDTDRGGRVTYHGPGQLVAYPIVSLAPYGDDVHEYVRRLERVTIGALDEQGVKATTIEGLTGVWTRGKPPPGSPHRRAENGPIRPEIGPSAAGAGGKRARSARSGFTSAAGSPPTALPSTSTTTCSRSSGSSPVESRRRG